MATCQAGHTTTATDFCDQCGLPVVADPTPPAPAAEASPAPVTACPHCGTPRSARALFCETCGYDYTTGALPDEDLHTELGIPKPATPDAGPAWVAEVWTDPQWYAAQESTEPLPPQGPPRIVPLKESALIGRHSESRKIYPDIDCEPDTGCSRRQAYLTSAGGYWYINDLDSANGTFVAPATDPVPATPIAARTQVTPDDRIYVGAWTRIVVRPAIPAETAKEA